GNLWRKEMIARNDAVSQANRADASKLVVIGRSLPDPDRKTKLAYALASLQIMDSPDARRLATQVLADGPPPFIFTNNFSGSGITSFSPDDKWFALTTNLGLQLFPQDGSAPVIVTKDVGGYAPPQFTKDSKFLVWISAENSRNIQVWSVVEKKIVRTLSMPGFTMLSWR